MARYIDPPRFTTEERDEVIKLLRCAIAAHGGHAPKPLLMAYGRVLHGNDMTADECERALGRNWYISQTGRKLKHRRADERPITPKAYDAATRMCILMRAGTQRAV